MANQIVLVPQHIIDLPPSVKDGIPREVEVEQRIYGCQLIQKAGVVLKLEAVSIASAQTILHRFYFRKSLKKFDVRVVAMASLLLACKLEEDTRRAKTLIDVIHFLTKNEDNSEMEIDESNIDDFLIDHESEEFLAARTDLFRCERYILRELGFMVSQTLVHPHRYILQYIHALFKGNYVCTNKLSQVAWGYLNDSMRTILCCQVQPAVIAVGSIFLAACDIGIPLAKEILWFDLFDVTWDDVMKVCATILSLYTREQPKYKRMVSTKRHFSSSKTVDPEKSIQSPMVDATDACEISKNEMEDSQVVSNDNMVCESASNIVNAESKIPPQQEVVNSHTTGLVSEADNTNSLAKESIHAGIIQYIKEKLEKSSANDSLNKAANDHSLPKSGNSASHTTQQQVASRSQSPSRSSTHLSHISMTKSSQRKDESSSRQVYTESDNSVHESGSRHNRHNKSTAYPPDERNSRSRHGRDTDSTASHLNSDNRRSATSSMRNSTHAMNDHRKSYEHDTQPIENERRAYPGGSRSGRRERTDNGAMPDGNRDSRNVKMRSSREERSRSPKSVNHRYHRGHGNISNPPPPPPGRNEYSDQNNYSHYQGYRNYHSNRSKHL